MKRWALKLTLATIAGAVVTWLTAWGCALWGRPAAWPGVLAYTMSMDQATTNTGETTPALPRECGAGWESPSGYGEWASAFQTKRFWRRDEPIELDVEITEFGLPLRSMRSAHIPEPPDPLPPPGARIVYWLRSTALRVPWLSRISTESELPITPIPSGFALDTALAAGLVLGMVEGFGAAKRWRRRSNGRCTSCGYNRGGLARDVACPECGMVKA